ncbi:hypothetical protein ACE7GA_21870 [Roseomonas sp. CCTCC AB2023176]|uniref:hypothetical protein n=1 Tax=Roseomonas sp. CCTCC AB2023176 TaxID=3342640 RepID=UPI0035DAFF20
MPVRRIVFAGDVLHPEGDPAGPWLRRLFGAQVAGATGIGIEVASFDTAGAYACWEAERSWDGWAAIADAGVAPAQALALFEAAFADALVLGFGLPPVAKRVLSHVGLPFIDLAVHPLRFLEDLSFAAQTNDPGVFAGLLPHHAEGSRFRAAAGLVAAAAPWAEPASAVLLVGQQARDPALLHRGRFADFADFPRAVRGAAGALDGAAFRPHPAEPGDFGLVAAGVPITALRLTRADFYGLMASGEVTRIVGLSSPVLTEASYFGCAAERLLDDPFDLADLAAEAEPGQHLSLVDGFWVADFWRDVLSPLMPVTRADGQRWRPPPNALRAAVGRLRGPGEPAPAPWSGSGRTSEAFRDDPAEAQA